MKRLSQSTRRNVAFSLFAIAMIVAQIASYIAQYPSPLWYGSFFFVLGLFTAVVVMALTQ